MRSPRMRISAPRLQLIYKEKAGAFRAALVVRARHPGAYLEDPPRVGLAPEAVTLMQAIGVPPCDIPEVAATLR